MCFQSDLINIVCMFPFLTHFCSLYVSTLITFMWSACSPSYLFFLVFMFPLITHICGLYVSGLLYFYDLRIIISALCMHWIFLLHAENICSRFCIMNVSNSVCQQVTYACFCIVYTLCVSFCSPLCVFSHFAGLRDAHIDLLC